MTTVASIRSGKLEPEKIRSTWQQVATIDANIEIQSTAARVLTALSLESHSDMWTWFDEQVTKPTRYLAEVPISALMDVQPHETPNDWIFPLFQAVQMPVVIQKDIDLQVQHFFPKVEAPNYHAEPGRGPMPLRILYHVEAAVILWLQFHPRSGMKLSTSRAIATFTSIAREAFKNTDFLYLNSIQTGAKKLRSILTEEQVGLGEVPWQKLAEELKKHPLARPDSDEALALDRLKELLWATSGFPYPHPSDMSGRYKRAVATGGGEGVEDFSEFMVQPRAG